MSYESVIIAVTASVSIVAIVAIVFGRNFQFRFRSADSTEVELSVKK